MFTIKPAMYEHLLLFFAPLLAGVGTWIFARRKMSAEANEKEAEASGKELANTNKMVVMWREFSEAMEKRSEEMEKRLTADIDKLRRENCDLQKRIDKVMEENKSLKEQMNGLKRENKKLQDQLKTFNKNINDGKDGTTGVVPARRRKTNTGS